MTLGWCVGWKPSLVPAPKSCLREGSAWWWGGDMKPPWLHQLLDEACKDQSVVQVAAVRDISESSLTSSRCRIVIAVNGARGRAEGRRPFLNHRGAESRRDRTGVETLYRPSSCLRWPTDRDAKRGKSAHARTHTHTHTDTQRPAVMDSWHGGIG